MFEAAQLTLVPARSRIIASYCGSIKNTCTLKAHLEIGCEITEVCQSMFEAAQLTLVPAAPESLLHIVASAPLLPAASDCPPAAW